MSTHHRRQVTDTTLDERVMSVLAAAAAPTEPGPLPGEVKALAAFRASQTAPRRPAMLSSLLTAKATAAAALSAGVLLTGSIGAATAGVLPAGAQDSASDLLSRVGMHVPTAAEAAGEDAQDQDATAGTDSEHGKAHPDTTHGHEVAETAHQQYATGRDKGEAVSEAASGSRSRAGGGSSDDHGSQAGAHQPSKPTQADGTGDQGDQARSDTPTDADAATAKADAASTQGSTKAGDPGTGHGTDGSANRP